MKRSIQKKSAGSLQRAAFGSLFLHSAFIILTSAFICIGQTAPTTQPYLDADQQATSAITTLYNASVQLSAANAALTSQKAQADSAAAAATIDAATQRALNATLNTQLSTLNVQLKAATQPTSLVHDAGGKASTLTLADGASLNGDKFVNAVFKAPQKYPLVTGSTAILLGVSATSDSGGIDVRGSNCWIVRTITNGSGQNGLSGGLANGCVIVGATSHGNNTGNFAVLNEAGGGKWSKCSNCAFCNCDFSNNLGVGLWFDVGCSNILIDGGTFNANAAADGKTQVANIRFEISQGLTVRNITSTVAGGMHTCLEICDSNHVTLSDSTINGQVGWDKTSRSGVPAVSDITITRNTINGSIYDSGIPPMNVSIDYDHYTTPKGQPIGYLRGATQYTIADMQKLGYEMHGTQGP